jgi:hypothetical protein
MSLRHPAIARRVPVPSRRRVRRLRSSGEWCARHEHQAWQFADRTTRTARDAIQKGTEAVEESTLGAERSFFAAADAARDFNMTLIEMAQSNAMAALNFAWEVATPRTHAAAVWHHHARKNFETLTEQSKQLMAVAQRLMIFAEPLPQTLQGTSFSRPFLRLVTP